MRTIIDSKEITTVEFLNRFLYSFQVLAVGIAIPVLFMMGISTKEMKSPSKEETRIENRRVLPVQQPIQAVAKI